MAVRAAAFQFQEIGATVEDVDPVITDPINDQLVSQSVLRQIQYALRGLTER